MSVNKTRRKEQGAALVISLLLLAVATIIGIAGLSGSNMQERIASNQKQQTEAMMAAETGISDAVVFVENNANWGGNTSCPPPAGTSWQDIDWSGYTSVGGLGAQFKRKLTCEDGSLFLISEGSIGDTERTVKVEFENLSGGSYTGNLAPINLVGTVPNGGFVAPNSNAFQVVGQGNGTGPAIATNNQSNANNIRAGIRNNRIQNYVGGVQSIAFDPPFDTATLLQDFVDEVTNSANYTGSNPQNLGTVDNPQVNVVQGDLHFQGNTSGAGVLVVTGDLSWQGTPAFDGVIIVLGGSFSAGGGGQGGINGAIYVANVSVDQLSGEWSFSNNGSSFNGGGNAAYLHSSSALSMAFGLLNDAARGMLNMGGGSGGAPTDDFKIANWKESM